MPGSRPAPLLASAGQRVSARVVDGVVDLVLFAIPFLAIPNSRPVARLFVGAALVCGYEAWFVHNSGSTPGKIVAGTRVAEIDSAKVGTSVAWLRALLVAISSLVIVVSPFLLISTLASNNADHGATVLVGLVVAPLAAAIVTSVFTSPQRRSFIDRLSDTAVVNRDAPTPVTTAQLADEGDSESRPADSRWGPLATLDQRRRARAGRLDDSPILVIALAAVVFATSVPHITPLAIALLGLVWEVAFVADETWRLSRNGGSSGHLRLGLAVVDVDTGEPPATLNSFSRAVLVSLPLYVLPAVALVGIVTLNNHPLMILPVLACLGLTAGFLVWVRVVPGRGPHDALAHTIVVAPRALASIADHG